MLDSSISVRTTIIKFLNRCKAKLDVADAQGQLAVYFASSPSWEDNLKILVDADEDLENCGAFGN